MTDQPIPDAADFAPGEDLAALRRSLAGNDDAVDELPRLLSRYEPLEGTPVVMADGRRWIVPPLALAAADPIFSRESDGRLTVRMAPVAPEHRALAGLVDAFLSDAPDQDDADAWERYMTETTETRLRIQFLALAVNYDIDCETVNREQIVKLHTFNEVLSALLGLAKKADGAGSN